MTQHTRRAFLAAAGGLSVGLAGCLGLESGANDSSSTTDESNGDSSVIRDARVEETELVIEVREETVDRITVIDPTGEAFADRELTPGATRMTIRIGTRYRPGEYRIHAVRDGEQIAESVMQIAPKVEIVDVRVGANHLDEMPEGLGNSRDVEAIVRIRNEGTGPTTIRGLMFEGDVPNPTEREEILTNNGRSGIYDSEDGGDLEEFMLTGGEQATLYSSTLPFSWARTAGGCQVSGGKITVLVLHGQALQETSWEEKVSYTPGSGEYKCETTLSEAE
ncbi:hypothetical protein [Halomarina rubra]|uniref:Uncharacterized protein n=1 Tax=Halomarina rubra TaxID=2071873 RepID=A0ABD6AX58_9EURY|nr:hypothetical protein [Halomarina rubra]